MTKYDPLREYLNRQLGSMIPMTFREIETVIGAKLPPSAYKHRPWWSNNPSNSVITHAWLKAGFETEQVDMQGKKLVFRRVQVTSGMAEEARKFESPTDPKRARRHPAFGALKGTFTIEAGWDLTRSSLDPDELEEIEANFDRTADLIDEGMKGDKR